MIKLENFTNYIKINGNPHAKNNLNYEITSDETVSIYYEGENGRRVLQKAIGLFNDWTDKDNSNYETLIDLTNDLDLFLYDSVSLDGVIDKLNTVNDNLCEIIEQLKVNNIHNSFITDEFIDN